ncbi:GTPase [Levilactobacillus brevis]|uniref:GTPase n=1 Tax=Levilactobacillus brevis TaxID=1580 RepID=UPI003D1735EE
MKAIIISGKENSGKTSICNELIGVRHVIFNNHPRKTKNKICVVNINGKNCLIVSEGDNSDCIDNIKLYYNEAKETAKVTSIDVLIVTARVTKDRKLVEQAKTILKGIDPAIKISEIETSKRNETTPDFSISKEFYDQGKKVIKKI